MCKPEARRERITIDYTVVVRRRSSRRDLATRNTQRTEVQGAGGLDLLQEDAVITEYPYIISTGNVKWVARGWVHYNVAVDSICTEDSVSVLRTG
jgi:hypothetical protein